MTAAAAELDVARARELFPALNPATAPSKQVFLDNAGGTQILGTAARSVTDYLLATNVQLGASYTTSEESTKRYYAGMAAAARYVNAAQDEIVLGPSTTQLFRNLAIAMIPHLQSRLHAASTGASTATHNGSTGRPELVVSMLDHEANIASWVFLADTLGLTIRWWAGDAATATPTGQHSSDSTTNASFNPHLTPDSLRPLLSPDTFLVTCTHASNLLGSITPVRALADLIHGTVPGALLAVDAVAYAPHARVDMQALGADFYAFSWYKMFGPHCAQLYAARPAQARVLASLGHFFKLHRSLEDKLGLAGASYELVQALPCVTAYLDSLDWPAVAAHEQRLQATLLDYLRSKPDQIQICGEPDADRSRRVPVVSFIVRGMRSQDVVERTEKTSPYGFRFGHFYSKRMVESVMHLQSPDDGCIRVSMVHYNTVDEIKGFVAALDKTISAS